MKVNLLTHLLFEYFAPCVFDLDLQNIPIHKNIREIVEVKVNVAMLPVKMKQISHALRFHTNQRTYFIGFVLNGTSPVHLH